MEHLANAACRGANAVVALTAGMGETALRRIFQRLDADRSGSHQDPRSGGADERTGAHLPWEFGDERPIDAVRTVQNAVLRTSAGAVLQSRNRVSGSTWGRRSSSIRRCWNAFSDSSAAICVQKCRWSDSTRNTASRSAVAGN